MKLYTKSTIASLLFAATTQVSLADNILIIMSDEDHLKLKGTDVYQTGFYLNELMQPVKLFLDEGHELTFATPKGLAPSLDVVSDNEMFFDNSKEQLEEHKALLASLKITDTNSSPVISLSRVEQIGYEKFDAVFLPGGHAPMNDLLRDKQLGSLLSYFNSENKVTALVCHGPIALLSTLPNANDFVDGLENGERLKNQSKWVYDGYSMTSFTNKEEEASKSWLGGGEMMFYPQTGLELAGAKFKESNNLWEVNVVVDRELITGQNPASAKKVAEEVLKKLKN